MEDLVLFICYDCIVGEHESFALVSYDAMKLLDGVWPLVGSLFF
jgi:hypothetical protein